MRTARHTLAALLLATSCVAAAEDMPRPLPQPQSQSGAETAAPAPTARGVLEATHTAQIAAPLAARLLKVPYRDGAAFGAGATLATFDCAAMEAEREALESAHRTLTLRHRNQSELFAMGAAGELDVQLAASEAAQAASEARAIATRLEDCTVHAPWAGTVVERHKQAFETPGVGEPIYSIVRAGRSEIVLIVPSAWSRWLAKGQRFDFTVDETGETFAAKVARVGATVDPVSQTLEIAASPTARIKARAGMSGTAVFAAEVTNAGDAP